jgi:hypothetical protein
MSGYFSSIPLGLAGYGATAVQHIRNSLVVGAVAYFVTIPFYSHNRTYYSPAAARKTLQVISENSCHQNIEFIANT